MAWFGALAVLPDVDFLLEKLDWTSAFVHRAATHSLFFACMVGALAGWLVPPRGVPRLRAIAWAIPVLASHGLLDAITHGGRGIELLWPLSTARYMPPWRPFPAVPAPHLKSLLTSVGLTLLARETACALPLLAYALWPRQRWLSPSRDTGAPRAAGGTGASPDGGAVHTE